MRCCGPPWTPPRQRHTIQRIYDRLVAEDAMGITASYRSEAFLEGDVYAFNVLGRGPSGKVRYGDLRSAVSRVLGLRDRRESDRWVAPSDPGPGCTPQ